MASIKSPNKKVFTTGAVARLFGININTVIKWFDEGKIDGFRLPISNDRRIPVSSLRKFMLENDIPMDLLNDDGPMRRKTQRVACSAPIRFTVENGKAYGPYDGELSDLSLGGARIQARAISGVTLPTQSFVLRMQWTEGPLAGTDFPGEVMHVRPGQDQLYIGMKFDELPERQQLQLNNYLETLLET